MKTPTKQNKTTKPNTFLISENIRKLKKKKKEKNPKLNRESECSQVLILMYTHKYPR